MLKDFIVFDFEVYPEWWCCGFGTYCKDIKDFEYKVITSDDANYLRNLKDFSRSGYLTGFNIKSYDMQILHFAILGYTTEELYEHSQKIINNKEDHWVDISYWRQYEFVDLFDDLKTMGSLKQFESNTGLPIEECTVPFGKRNLTQAEKDEIIRYNKADIVATNQLVTARWGYLMSKANCTKLSSLSEAECLKNTSAKVCAKMLKAKQLENPNPPYYIIPEKLDPLFRDTIHPTIMNTFDGTELVNDFSYKVRYFKNDIVYGTGGIHSTYEDSLYSISDEEYVLVNADFENLYPSLLVLFDYYATGVPESGKTLFKYLLNTCRSLKQTLRQMKAEKKFGPEFDELFNERDATKLILNASTGAMRLKFSDLYDPQNIISLCMTGQLLTTCMAKMIFNMDGLIIQTNTDGVTFRVPRKNLKLVYEQLANFSEKTGVPLEVDEEYAIFQKDVNNYILMSSPDAEPKLKGRWAKKSGSDVPLTPLFAPIINEAVVNYYCKNIPIEETIKSCNEPLKFMMTTMKGPTYSHVTYMGAKGEVLTTNINRVYASFNHNLGTLYKVKLDDEGQIYKHDKIASIPACCGLWNSEVPKTGYIEDLDYDWYIAEANKSLVSMKKIA